jgi:Ser/Thr protein kinase RdoA (MazF antagonist)
MADVNLGSPATQAEPEVALRAYDLSDSTLTPLTGGKINSVWRVDSAIAPHVLKRYDSRNAEQVRRSLEVQARASEGGVPIASVRLNSEGDQVTQVGETQFVLSEYVAGRIDAPDEMPPDAARRMGEMLGRLHASLMKLPPGVVQAFPKRRNIEGTLRLLLTMTEARRPNPVDERAAQNLRAKLDLLSRLDADPPIEGQWCHGDYAWRNVIFDATDTVAAVIDFDDARYASAGHEVMRCIALSFPSLGPEVDDFFAAYAGTRGLTPEAARGFVESYRYSSSIAVWPMTLRYLNPKQYEQRWDDLIQPFLSWDWGAMSERLTGLAVSATAAG